MIWYLLHSKTLQASKFLCDQTNSFYAVMSALNYISFLNEWSVVNCIKIYIFLEDVFSFQNIYAIPILFSKLCRTFTPMVLKRCIQRAQRKVHIKKSYCLNKGKSKNFDLASR